ncbi:MAG: peptidoglycan DD-metalloendopeptidase family protein [Clostridia bacterium]|nr:peptidoglycan DD-metalloendopeptidase family protein [Clostridia bacterium]
MELRKQEAPRQGNGLAIAGGCALLLIVANIFTAFVNGPQDAVELQAKQANQPRIHNRVAAALEKNVPATGIKINNKIEVILASEKDAQKVLQQLQVEMTGRPHPQARVKVKYDEQVEIVPVETKAGEISGVQEAVGLLKKGRVEVVTYTVREGENLWIIARKNDMRVREIREANPALKNDFVDVGQVINLVKPEPLVHIVATVENTVKEDIPFTVKVEQDKSLRRGSEKIKQPGKKGKKEVTYRTVLSNGVQVEKEVLSEKILAKPEVRVVARGNKGRGRMMIASRGEGGSGDLIWPVRGSITSGYGERWGREHTGIDIDGTTGEPVRAAEGGRVVYAGWDGEYGKIVAIDHGNGITTRYAHLSSIGVSVGDDVGRGEYIGDVGSTGRATGSNLHFEVLNNGAFRNPIGYLR